MILIAAFPPGCRDPLKTLGSCSGYLRPYRTFENAIDAREAESDVFEKWADTLDKRNDRPEKSPGTPEKRIGMIEIGTAAVGKATDTLGKRNDSPGIQMAGAGTGWVRPRIEVAKS